MEEKLDGNDTMMLCTVLSKSWKQHHTKQQLYSYLPPITFINLAESEYTLKYANCISAERWKPPTQPVSLIWH